MGRSLCRRDRCSAPDPNGDSLADPRRARNPDPDARGQPRAPHGDRESRCLVGLPPRPAAHVPFQPQGQRRCGRIVLARRLAGSTLRARPCGTLVRTLPDRVPAQYGRPRHRDRAGPSPCRARRRPRPARSVRQLHDGTHLLAGRRPRRQPRLARALDVDQPELCAGHLRPRLDRDPGGTGPRRPQARRSRNAIEPAGPAVLRDARDSRLHPHDAGRGRRGRAVGRTGSPLTGGPRADCDDRNGGPGHGGRRGARGGVGGQRARSQCRPDPARLFPFVSDEIRSHPRAGVEWTGEIGF